MLPPRLTTPRDAGLYHDKIYDELVNSGQAHPFVFPWASVGVVVVLAYLLIDHRRSAWLKWCRYPVFAFFVGLQGWIILTHRAKNPASTFGIGILAFWAILWVLAHMILKDCQTDFKRIERADESEEQDQQRTRVDETTLKGKAKTSQEDAGLRRRKRGSSTPQIPSTKGPAGRHGRLFWQPYPAVASIERLDWICDAFNSIRGIGWNWQSSGVPRLPKWAAAQLNGENGDPEETEHIESSKSGIRRYSSRKLVLAHTVMELVFGYLTLNTLVCLMHHDPYFWTGNMEAPAPTYLPSVLQASFVLTRTYRLLLSLSAIYVALWTLFKVGPIIYCGLLGPGLIGLRGEPLLNPVDMYGNFSLVLDKGLAGWWGGWWHQAFRVTFEVPGMKLIDAFGVSKKSTLGRMLLLSVAFFFSGVFHACASYTQLFPTRPLSGPMLFFNLQTVGVVVQTLAAQQLQKVGIVAKCPIAIRRLTNFMFVFTWMYFTAPLLTDDLSQGGVWLFGPLPLSPLEAVGLGTADEKVFHWNDILRWHRGEHWWDTGLAL